MLAVALATFILTACSAGPKSDPTPVSNTAPTNVAQTAPVTPPTTPTVSDPAPVKTPTKSRIAPPATPKLVTIQNFEFKPASLTVSKGTIVKWINNDSMPHTVTSDAFQSGLMQQGNFFTYQFDTAGNFPYSCKIHPSMKGGIIVKP